MASSNRHSREQGFLIIDVLIGLFVASIIITAFLGSVVAAVRYASMQAKAVQAELLAIEMVEVARELEMSDWSALRDASCTEENPCHPRIDSGTGGWELVATSTPVDGLCSLQGFECSLYIEDVPRDTGTYAIDNTGGDFIDEGDNPFDASRKVTAQVAWVAYGEPRSLALETYVYEYVSIL